ncbi:MAG: hypothetical protein WDA41_09235 [Candidatus Neomarinimicrobiota bacterium]
MNNLPEQKSLAELALESASASGIGLTCPRCGCIQFGGKSVRNTRMVEGGIRRYRVCRHCGKTWCTTEK